jgi:hypothetical protein
VRKVPTSITRAGRPLRQPQRLFLCLTRLALEERHIFGLWHDFFHALLFLVRLTAPPRSFLWASTSDTRLVIGCSITTVPQIQKMRKTCFNSHANTVRTLELRTNAQGEVNHVARQTHVQRQNACFCTSVKRDGLARSNASTCPLLSPTTVICVNGH